MAIFQKESGTRTTEEARRFKWLLEEDLNGLYYETRLFLGQEWIIKRDPSGLKASEQEFFHRPDVRLGITLGFASGCGLRTIGFLGEPCILVFESPREFRIEFFGPRGLQGRVGGER